MGELDSAKGIGLIERERRGLGKPNVIYVKNFISAGNESSAYPLPGALKAGQMG